MLPRVLGNDNNFIECALFFFSEIFVFIHRSLVNAIFLYFTLLSWLGYQKRVTHKIDVLNVTWNVWCFNEIKRCYLNVHLFGVGT